MRPPDWSKSGVAYRLLLKMARSKGCIGLVPPEKYQSPKLGFGKRFMDSERVLTAAAVTRAARRKIVCRVLAAPQHLALRCGWRRHLELRRSADGMS